MLVVLISVYPCQRRPCKFSLLAIMPLFPQINPSPLHFVDIDPCSYFLVAIFILKPIYLIITLRIFFLLWFNDYLNRWNFHFLSICHVYIQSFHYFHFNHVFVDENDRHKRSPYKSVKVFSCLIL